jgi:hypothetical protein
VSAAARPTQQAVALTALGRIALEAQRYQDAAHAWEAVARNLAQQLPDGLDALRRQALAHGLEVHR